MSATESLVLVACRHRCMLLKGMQAFERILFAACLQHCLLSSTVAYALVAIF